MQPNIFTGFDSGIMSDPPNRDPPPLAEQFNHCPAVIRQKTKSIGEF